MRGIKFMQEYSRHIENRVKRISKYFKVILLVGARQVGKSTLFKKVFPKSQCITFDAFNDEFVAKKDPDLFLKSFPSPIILDEVQYVPELLSAVKRKVDKSPKFGQYFLTGSQNLMMLKSVSESMAGRVGILELSPMTYFELNKKYDQNFLEIYLKKPESLLKKFSGCLHPKKNLYEILWRGGFPALLKIPNEGVRDYFSSYVKTYLERDVRTFGNVSDIRQFDRFLSIAAALTAQEINYSHLGREIGIVPATAGKWLDVLSCSYLWFELLPFNFNVIKRVSKKRKGHILDSGLTCYLQKITSPEALAASPLKGAIFESYCISMIKALTEVKNSGIGFSHFRTDGGAEVDLILEQNGWLYPIEIKCKSYLDHYDKRGIESFCKTFPKRKIAHGLIIYAGEECYKLSDKIIAMPWNALFGKK